MRKPKPPPKIRIYPNRESKDTSIPRSPRFVDHMRMMNEAAKNRQKPKPIWCLIEPTSKEELEKRNKLAALLNEAEKNSNEEHTQSENNKNDAGNATTKLQKNN